MRSRWGSRSFSTSEAVKPSGQSPGVATKILSFHLGVTLLCCVACGRGSNAHRDASAADASRVFTSVLWTVERFEEQNAATVAAQEEYDRENGVHTQHDGLPINRLRAFDLRSFVLIKWQVRYPHGMKVSPRVTVVGRTIRCAIDQTGARGSNATTDQTEFQTRLDHLPAGRYRIFAPLYGGTLDEATLEVR
jgi:hypothetical protein